MEKLVVCSAAVYDPYSKSTEYLLDNYLDEVKAGVKKYAGTVGAKNIMYLLPDGSKSYGLENEVFGTASPVMDNPYAVSQVLQGKLPRPMIQDDYVTFCGDRETLVIVPELAYNLAVEPTKFVTVNRDENSEVKAVPYGTKLSEVCDSSRAKFILLGGLKGRFILPENLSEYEAGDGELSTSITVYEDDVCIVDVNVQLMNEIWENSCGKCVLCRDGTYQVKNIMADIPAGKAKMSDVDILNDIVPLIKAGSYCPYGQNWPNVLLSAMELHGDEFEEHIKRKICRTGVCYSAGDTYVILPDKCSGCMECMDVCDAIAIEGKKGFIHMIDQDMCEHCGKCVESCDEEAIVKWEGAKLPKLPKKPTRVGKFR